MNQEMLMVLLGVVLLQTFYVTIKKAIDTYKKESVKKNTQREALLERKESKRQMRMSRTALSILRIRDRDPSLTLKKIVEEEGTHFTLKRMTKIIGTFVILFLTLFIMGSEVFPDKESNYTLKAVAFLSYVIFSLWATVRASRDVQDIHKIKRYEDYERDEADLHFEDRKVVKKLVLGCFLSGILSGILGIAGGTIMGPLFLSLKMIPEVVSATN